MKLHALRIAQFRKFQSPVAIEGMRDGLNVLAGPNEFGKSTLFDALVVIFMLRFKTTGAALERLRPYGGGDPLVEVDFEHDGAVMRLQKQFGRGAKAVLTDLNHGRVIARNNDVEDQLEKGLFGAHSASAGAGLLWVAQQHGLRLPAPDFDPETKKPKDRGERALLRAILQDEIEAMSRGAIFDRVLLRTTEALDQILTPTRTNVRKNSALDVGERHVDDLSKQLARSEEAVAAIRAKAHRLAEAEQELAKVSDAATLDKERTEIAALTKQLASAQNSHDRLTKAREVLELSVLKKQQISARLEKIEGDQRVCLQLNKSLAAARDLEEKISAFAAELNNEPVTAIEIERLVGLENRLAIAKAQIEAQSAQVSVSLRPGGEGRVRYDGASVTDGSTLKIADKAIIEIEDIADIEISMPGAGKAAAAKVEIADLNAERSKRFKALSVESLDEAKSRYQKRKASEVTLDDLRTQLIQIAPTGTAELAKRLSELTAPSAEDLDGLKTELSAADEVVANARLAVNEAIDLAVDEQGIAKLAHGLEQKKKLLDARIERARGLQVQVAGLKGEITGGNDSWQPGSVAELREGLERAKQELRRLERKRDSLLLLENLLKKLAIENRQKFAAPLVQRLAPKVAELLNAQGLNIDNELAAQHVQRAGCAEPVTSLSDGAREQLGLLIRLAIAESLHHANREMPLVLDDPLAYTDAQRFSAMCRQLERAATDFQIVVFTCREQAFRELSGHRLDIQPWRPDI